MTNIPKKCVVIGAGGQCRVVVSLLRQIRLKFSVEGILDYNQPELNEKVSGISIIGSIQDSKAIYKSGINSAFLAVGDNELRNKFHKQLTEIGFQLPNLIAPNAYIDPSATLGNGNTICSFSHIGPEANIGDNNIINTGVVFEHETSIQHHSHVAPNVTICGRTKIGSFVFIGAGATIINNIIIGSNTTIGAGSVVINNIMEQNETYMGVPAKLKT